jgi:hypothetical protein
MSSKKPCINNPAFSYTGNEQSPLHFGLSAEGYAINSIMEGYDKKLWMVEIKNNKKVWVRKEDNFKVTHEEPVIKTEEETSIIENEVITLPSVPSVEKKTTDYNLYLSWRLKQLKEEATSETQENKKNFAKVLEEWKLIKHNPNELQKVLEEAKKYMAQKSMQTKPAIPKKKPSTKLPSIQEETTEGIKKQTKKK